MDKKHARNRHEILDLCVLVWGLNCGGREVVDPSIGALEELCERKAQERGVVIQSGDFRREVDELWC